MSALTKGRKCVADVLSRVDRDVSTDELVDLLEEEGYWTEEYDRRSNRKSKRYDVRVLVRQVHYDSDGNRIEFMHIRMAKNPKTGRQVQIYKQLRFFVDEDFVQAASSYYQRGAYHFGVVKRLVRLAAEKYGRTVQTRFPFAEIDDSGEVHITLPKE
jgi:Fe2+ or Zn2+ uptake regulation protein